MPSPKSPSAGSRGSGGAQSSTKTSTSSEDSRSLAEQLVNRIIKPLGLVVLTRERIQEVLDDAAAGGRVSRAEAKRLLTDLVHRSRQQTDQLVADIERLLGRGREQCCSAIRVRRGESLDLSLPSADKTRRTAERDESLPILVYDELTAAQVQTRLGALSPPELRRVRDYERRHANRKSVLTAIDKHLTAD